MLCWCVSITLLPLFIVQYVKKNDMGKYRLKNKQPPEDARKRKNPMSTEKGPQGDTPAKRLLFLFRKMNSDKYDRLFYIWGLMMGLGALMFVSQFYFDPLMEFIQPYGTRGNPHVMIGLLWLWATCLFGGILLMTLGACIVLVHALLVCFFYTVIYIPIEPHKQK